MLITILTPTYNRKNRLPNLFESLCKQTNMNFQWLVIDDGSTDGTDGWFSRLPDTIFEKEYHKKENGGKHTALNYSHPYIKGELVFIVDSDDEIVPTAIETILRDWKEIESNNQICSIVYLCGSNEYTPFNNMIFPNSKEITNNTKQLLNRNKNQETATVIRTSVMKEFVFPVFQGEKYIGEGYLFNLAGYKYQSMYVNKIIYIAEYLEDGLTKAGRKLRIQAPLGGMEVCKTRFDSRVCLKLRIKSVWLYICYGKFAGLKFKEIRNRSELNIGWLYVNYVFGYLLYRYWKNKYGDA